MGLTKLVTPHLFRIIKTSLLCRHFCSKSYKKPPWRVMFFGADEFSIFSLQSLTREYRKGSLINDLQVATTINNKSNLVKLFAEKQDLRLHRWPPNISKGEFDVGLVVSFGHLIPKDIIEKFEFGMLNIHASLLPRWRGAAPIIYAIANGDSETGITIMKISPEKFDVGEIVHQESIPIHPDMKMKELYTILGKLGAEHLIKTLESLPTSLQNAKPQPDDGITYAPKVSADLAHVKWDKMTSLQIYNLARALDGVFHIQTTWNDHTIKLMNIGKTEQCSKVQQPGYIQYDKESKLLKVSCADLQFITAEKVGVVGKRVMSSTDFNNGYIKKQPPNTRYFK